MFRGAVASALVAAVSWCGVMAAPPAGYYDSAEGKMGVELRAALHGIIKGHRTIPYSGGATSTVDALRVLEEDPANTNNVVLIYARRSDPKSAFGVTGGWEREHVWPDGRGLNGLQPARSDLHNLRAEDSNVNAARQKKYYDVSDPGNPSYRVPAHVEAPLTSTDSDSWEPPTVVKGDLARALFYMAVRYTGDTNNEPALFLTDATNQLPAATNMMGRLSMLLRWHLDDPVDDGERRRNDLVFQRYQGNRNPFVDRPEWVQAAFWPVMTFTLTEGTNLTASWPAEYSMAVFEYARHPIGTWGPAGGNRSTNGGRIYLGFYLPLESPEEGFFRLRLP